jgi:hypothetical protein
VFKKKKKVGGGGHPAKKCTGGRRRHMYREGERSWTIVQPEQMVT